MPERFTLQIERQGDWFVGSCPEVPGANGQGRTVMSCSRNLVQAIALLLEEEEPVPVTATVEVEAGGNATSYKVELLESLEGFSVGCPELPGCFSQGDDKEEALENIRSAIKDYVEVARGLKPQSGPPFVRVA